MSSSQYAAAQILPVLAKPHPKTKLKVHNFIAKYEQVVLSALVERIARRFFARKKVESSEEMPFIKTKDGKMKYYFVNSVYVTSQNISYRNFCFYLAKL